VLEMKNEYGTVTPLSAKKFTLIVIPAIYAVVKGIAIRLPRLTPSLQQP
jgi:hypothetical protein